MLPSYTVNALNALVLLLAGLISYALHPVIEMLIAPLLGVILLLFTYHLRRHNRFVLHTITAITLLAGIYFMLLFEPELFSWENEQPAFLVMGLSCFIATLFYVGSFVRERRQRDNTLYKEDL
ncbi:hypothetical protein [Pontibacter arcticus]|uniref:Uncharacterized protein n=1 Tax=Pontibacter arcticus TaxID=2080288 RepID=A0A364RCE1_9BACT|nr:hypothetical protein [Pontibacter arcticus]RAU81934.1 hypothetical protein DP923_14710 [Pontibacter arcticus]